MRLSQFILDNIEEILQQWEDFARTLKPAPTMSLEALRDDAENMLRFVAADIESDQTAEQEVAKATGHAPALPPGQLSAAHAHGVARAAERFSLIELVSEYRALRASVARMWMRAVPMTRESVAQIVRFNEAIDQTLAEAVAKFTERLDRDADLFTGSIGHDLSNPVNTIAMSASLLTASGNLSDAERAAAERIERAADRLSGMLVDLRDFTRTRLGGFLHLDRKKCDVCVLARHIVDELSAIFPNRHIAVDCRGDAVATVDAKRLSQLLSNLVANALQHGPANVEVKVSVHGDADMVNLQVHNTGPAIDPVRVKTLFDPLAREASDDDDARLGLGLYIAQQIAIAHDGTIGVESDPGAGTQFTVRIPREPKAATSA